MIIYDKILEKRNNELRMIQTEIYNEFLKPVWEYKCEHGPDEIENMDCQKVLHSLYKRLISLKVDREYLNRGREYCYFDYTKRLIKAKTYLDKELYGNACIQIEYMFTEQNIGNKIYMALIHLLKEYFDEDIRKT